MFSMIHNFRDIFKIVKIIKNIKGSDSDRVYSEVRLILHYNDEKLNGIECHGEGEMKK